MEGIKRSLLFALFLIMCTLVQGQRLTVQGKVVSKTDGESIIGATVIETNQTSNGTITDIDGNFTLSVPQGAELSISYIGFKTVNVKAQATLNIVLEEESELLQEVVVTGYTTQRKADLTGAISVPLRTNILPSACSSRRYSGDACIMTRYTLPNWL